MLRPLVTGIAATTTLYVSPSGTGSACSSAEPCSLDAAQTAVRSQNGSMSGDIVVQLADGVYRRTSPLRFTAADSGSDGYRVVWQAAPGARPVISGARQVTGWTVADSGKNVWKASVGTGIDTRQLYVDGRMATRARTTVNRADFTATGTGLRFGNSALSYLNNLAGQSRIELQGIGSFTDRYVPVQSISGNFITMKQPAWNNNTFGYDTIVNPYRKGPMYLENAYEFLDSPGEWYLSTGTGVLYYIPPSGKNMSTADVELPSCSHWCSSAAPTPRPRTTSPSPASRSPGRAGWGPAATRGTPTSRRGRISRATGTGRATRCRPASTGAPSSSRCARTGTRCPRPSRCRRPTRSASSATGS
ncbi:hypothetical protein [Microbispora triticiradicis]|uniref:hypothetical protein n=1 Tax=Microbispora triticiradicis TaxID=2200763 RepID=UPI001AD7945E|nr:hypothetical protein [Microbispora triticiradicis]MBO4275450.1 hypothetical protein [Microbispora triticiradicis]